MSRREIVVNVLLGTLLLLSFAFLAALLLGAAVLVIYSGVHAFEWLFPDRHPSVNVVFYSFLSVWSIWYGAGHVRKRYWRNAFTSFSLVALFVSQIASHIHFASRSDILFLAPWWLIALIPTDFLLPRVDFTLSAFVVGVTFAVNAGLLGAGTLAQWAIDCTFVAMLILWAIALRRQARERDGSHSAGSLIGA